MDFDELEQFFEQAEIELENKLRSLLYASGNEKSKIYYSILFLLAALKNKIQASSKNIISSLYYKHSKTLDQMKDQSELDIATLNYELQSSLSKALSNIYTVAFAYSTANKPEDLKKLNFLVKDPSKGQLVSVIGIGGKSYNFKLSYYTALVLNHIKSKTETLALINDAQQQDRDLVIVSPQASLHGDYCDAYTNAVFSISGSSKEFPPLYMTPNNGPPFHPNCRHSVSLYDPSEHKNVRKVEAIYLNTSVKDVAKAWWSRKHR